jgi:hypothetical protein
MDAIPRRKVFGLLLLLIATAAASDCRHRRSEAVQAQPPTPPKSASPLGSSPSRVDANWPSVAYAEVRAYYHKDAGALLDTILDNGALDKLAVNKAGTPLTIDQTRRLLVAFTGNHKSYESFACFNPRHAFIFYDKLHKAVAAIEVCFDCYVVDMTPGGMPDRVDLPAVADIVNELGLPIHPDGLTAREFRADFEAAGAERRRG